MGESMLSYSGGTAPVFHRLPCYALAGTQSVLIQLSEGHGVYTPGKGEVKREKFGDVGVCPGRRFVPLAHAIRARRPAPSPSTTLRLPGEHPGRRYPAGAPR